MASPSRYCAFVELDPSCEYKTGSHTICFCITFLIAILLSGCGVSQSETSRVSNTLPPDNGTIPASYWGIIVNQATRFPAQVPYGEFRAWDAVGAQWPDIETCQASGNPTDPCYTWYSFDLYMNKLYEAGVTNVMYTMSRTPLWGVDLNSDPTGLNGTDCNYYIAGSPKPTRGPGQCLPPVDLNPDGSGADQIWKNWVTAIATRTNTPSYLQTHAHINYWEPWNEYYRSSVLRPNLISNNLSFEGTYAQLVRLTEDMRCTITGKGTIHNYPQAGQSAPCSATPIDSKAVIVSPSGSASFQQGLDVVQNFLYCSGTGAHAPAAGSYCTAGSAGSEAVDVINFHLYADTITPETVAGIYVPNARAILQPADLKKPMINGEGSWSNPAKPGDLWADPYAQAGFIPRFFALYWSAGLTMNMWYSYDTIVGELFNAPSGQLNRPVAPAWTETNKWLVGAMPDNNPFCANSGTVYTCDFKEADGKAAELVWDAQYGQNCSEMSNPEICGNTPYNVPGKFNQDWIDVSGAKHGATNVVTIGANPILLEGQ